MFGKKKEKEKKVREPFNPRKEAKLLPGYIIVAIWVFFTIFLLLWILAASSFHSARDHAGRGVQV